MLCNAILCAGSCLTVHLGQLMSSINGNIADLRLAFRIHEVLLANGAVIMFNNAIFRAAGCIGIHLGKIMTGSGIHCGCQHILTLSICKDHVTAGTGIMLQDAVIDTIRGLSLHFCQIMDDGEADGLFRHRSMDHSCIVCSAFREGNTDPVSAGSLGSAGQDLALRAFVILVPSNRSSTVANNITGNISTQYHGCTVFFEVCDGSEGNGLSADTKFTTAHLLQSLGIGAGQIDEGTVSRNQLGPCSRILQFTGTTDHQSLGAGDAGVGDVYHLRKLLECCNSKGQISNGAGLAITSFRHDGNSATQNIH